MRIQIPIRDRVKYRTRKQLDTALNTRSLYFNNILCKLAFLVQYSRNHRNKVMNAHMH